MILTGNINEVTRKVTFEQTSAVVAVVGDYDVNGVAFGFPASYEDDFDLSTGVKTVYYEATDGTIYNHVITDTDTDTGLPLWVFTDEINKGEAGTVKFAIVIDQVDSDANITKRWVSLITSFQVRQSIEIDTSEEEANEQTYSERLATLMTQVAAMQTVVDGLASGTPTAVSTVAEMTNESLIYLYTGSESGYTAGNWYYYNGSAWTSGGAYGNSSEVIAARTNADTGTTYTDLQTRLDTEYSEIKEDLSDVETDLGDLSNLTTTDQSNLVAAINEVAERGSSDVTETVSTVGNNILNPAEFYLRGFHYDWSTGVETEDTSGLYMVSNKISLPEDGGIMLYMTMQSTYGGNQIYTLCWDEDGTYLGRASATFYANTAAIQSTVLQQGTTTIVLEVLRADVSLASLVCISQVPLDAYEAYSITDTTRIDPDLIDMEAVGITEQVAGGYNLLDPKNLNTWGYHYDLQSGELTESGTSYCSRFQVTADKISVPNATAIYVRSTVALSDSDFNRFIVMCYEGDDYLGKVETTLTTLDEIELALVTGTDSIHIYVIAYPYNVCGSDLCVSTVSLDAFEAYTSTQKIKSALIPELDESAVLKCKRSNLYGKNILWFGDSTSPDTLVNLVIQATGANITNLALGGTSMSQRNTIGVHTMWYTMTNIADCIASGDWTTTIDALTADSETTAVSLCEYMRDLDWSTVDAIVIAHGANDTDITDVSGDVTTYGGAIRNVIAKLLSTYPGIRLIFASVIWNATQNNTSDKRDMLQSICEEYRLPFIDNWGTIGLNSVTASELLADGLHPSKLGREILAAHYVHELW